MVCDCCLRNIQDSVTDGRTPYEKRFDAFDDLIWPLGAEMLYKPISQKDKRRLHQLGDKRCWLAGVFIGEPSHSVFGFPMI